MKLIEVLVGNFMGLVQIKPREFYSTSLYLAIVILEIDGINTGNVNTEWLEKLYFIKENTHSELNIPLAKAEAIIDGTKIESWGREVPDLEDNFGKRIDINGRPMKVIDVHQRLKESYLPVLQAVSNVVRTYSLDIRMDIGGDSLPSWLKTKDETSITK